MRKHFKRLRRDERGMSLVLVGMGFMGFMAATTLAIDVGMFMTARSQAQNAADAGALSGAVALVFNDYNDRSDNGPAVQSAINASLANVVMGGDVSVGPDDVTFPLSPAGVDNRVRVIVRRNTERGNSIPTLIGPLFGVPTVDIVAVATAEASAANAAMCAMPFTIPDRWTEKQTGEWDPLDDFNMYASNGNPLANPDIYIGVGQEGATGYVAERDKGLQITLKNNNLNKTAPSFYNPYRLGVSNGAEDYRENIGGCNTHIVAIGDLIDPEPGNMVGPTKQGMDDLILKDPNAYWNESCNCIRNSDPKYGISPRVTIIPLYDPIYYETGKHNGSNASLKVANLLGFFIEEMDGNEVVGRITPVTAMVKGNGVGPQGAFAQAIRLVE